MTRRLSILVVDDSPTQVAVLRDALEKRGFSVLTAANGIEAIEKVYQNPPHLVLSDVIMPELNGYHLCRLLKNDPNTSPIPVVLLTHLSEQHDRFWGRHAGADLFLEKTSPTSQIAEKLAELLERCPLPENRRQRISRSISPIRADIQERIADILDRLLYESTISNEILKLTSLAHDVKAFCGELLKFLGAICRHDAAGLLLNQSRDRRILAFSLNAPMPDDFVGRAQEMMLRHAGIDDAASPRSQLLIFPEEPAREFSGPASDTFHVFHVLPVKDGDELLALICLFSRTPREINDGIGQAMRLVGERFLIVSRYLCKLAEIEEVKADFVSMLVHDLRSPLTSIRGFSDALIQGLLGPLNDDQKSALENIQGGSDRLLFLIEDILHFSKLEAGKMTIHPAPFSISMMTQQTVNDLAALFLEKDIQVEFRPQENLPVIIGDEQQLSRVITNLLTNAVKFSPRGGIIEIHAEVVQENGNKDDARLRMDVIDLGPGIPPEQQRELFARYQQVAPKSRKGTGLGLAICKEIVNLHNGRIWVESPVKDERGSRFSFTLPLPCHEALKP